MRILCALIALCFTLAAQNSSHASTTTINLKKFSAYATRRISAKFVLPLREVRKRSRMFFRDGVESFDDFLGLARDAAIVGCVVGLPSSRGAIRGQRHAIFAATLDGIERLSYVVFDKYLEDFSGLSTHIGFEESVSMGDAVSRMQKLLRPYKALKLDDFLKDIHVLRVYGTKSVPQLTMAISKVKKWKDVAFVEHDGIMRQIPYEFETRVALSKRGNFDLLEHADLHRKWEHYGWTFINKPSLPKPFGEGPICNPSDFHSCP